MLDGWALFYVGDIFGFVSEADIEQAAIAEVMGRADSSGGEGNSAALL